MHASPITSFITCAALMLGTLLATHPAAGADDLGYHQVDEFFPRTTGTGEVGVLHDGFLDPPGSTVFYDFTNPDGSSGAERLDLATSARTPIASLPPDETGRTTSLDGRYVLELIDPVFGPGDLAVIDTVAHLSIGLASGIYAAVISGDGGTILAATQFGGGTQEVEIFQRVGGVSQTLYSVTSLTASTRITGLSLSDDGRTASFIEIQSPSAHLGHVFRSDPALPPRVIIGTTRSPVLLPADNALHDVGFVMDIRPVRPIDPVITVTQDEPVGSSPGDVGPDAEVIRDAGNHIVGLRLRAARDPAGNGRVYLITISATDPFTHLTGRAATAVVVPKSASIPDLFAVLSEALAAVSAAVPLPYDSLQMIAPSGSG